MGHEFVKGDRVRLLTWDSILTAECEIAVGAVGEVVDSTDFEGDVFVRWAGGDFGLYVKPASLELEDANVAAADAGMLAAGRLFMAAGKLGPRAMVVLAAVAERLAKGAAEHGDFENLDRDWKRESLEEQLDDLVYRTVLQLRSTGAL